MPGFQGNRWGCRMAAAQRNSGKEQMKGGGRPATFASFKNFRLFLAGRPNTAQPVLPPRAAFPMRGEMGRNSWNGQCLHALTSCWLHKSNQQSQILKNIWYVEFLECLVWHYATYWLFSLRMFRLWYLTYVNAAKDFFFFFLLNQCDLQTDENKMSECEEINSICFGQRVQCDWALSLAKLTKPD